MKYLWVKFRRDFVKLFPQFISVFMMALLSVTIFAGFESTWTGGRPGETGGAESGLPDRKRHV